jgi:hypothetical protein
MAEQETGVSKRVIGLANTVFWNPHEDDKLYLKYLHIGIGDFPFTQRLVFLRFGDGLALDFSTFDMDRIAVEYLAMRGVKLPADVRALARSEPPPQCDFLVPNRILPDTKKQAKGRRRASQTKPKARRKSNRRTCSRCRRRLETSGDWLGALCPRCADETDGNWVCHLCGRRGSFEAMGECGASNPICCGSPCERVPPESG